MPRTAELLARTGTGTRPTGTAADVEHGRRRQLDTRCGQPDPAAGATTATARVSAAVGAGPADRRDRAVHDQSFGRDMDEAAPVGVVFQPLRDV